MMVLYIVILLWIRSHDGDVYCYIVIDKVP